MSTFLDIVNSVLSHLREDEVAESNDTAYSKLICRLVNDTKRECEDAWNWSQLRTNITVTTTAGTTNYALTGTNRRSRIIEGYNYTQGVALQRLSNSTYNSLTLTGTVHSASVESFRIRGISTVGELKIDVYPSPSGTETLIFDVVVPQNEFSITGMDDLSDITLEPTMIIYGTWAKAISERGEDGGALFEEVLGMYKRAMADAISYDVAQHLDGETDWHVC